MNAAVLKELGARTRVFRSLTHALTWWRTERLRRGLHAMPLEAGGMPRDQAKVDESHATYAAVTACLGRHHEADLDSWPMSEWRVGALAHWLDSDEMGRTFMAEKLGWGVRACESFMGETAHVLTRRLRERELIP